jgi:hypothetical protein
MANDALGDLIATHREELIRRCSAKVAERSTRAGELGPGISLFLDQLLRELEAGPSQTVGIRSSASQHGQSLFFQGFTIGQVVHAYGDVCQSVTDLAVELDISFDTGNFRTMNRCLDDAIAGAVCEYTRLQRVVVDRESLNQSIHAKNLIFTAITAFEALQTGTVGIGGATGDLLYRSLLSIRAIFVATRD